MSIINVVVVSASETGVGRAEATDLLVFLRSRGMGAGEVLDFADVSRGTRIGPNREMRIEGEGMMVELVLHQSAETEIGGIGKVLAVVPTAQHLGRCL